MIIRSGSCFNLSTLPATEYPNIEDWESVLEFDISQLELKKLIDATQFSMASQDVRYYLNGMLFESEGHGLHRRHRRSPPGHLPPRGCRGIAARSSGHPARKGVLELVRLLEAEDKPKVACRVGRGNHVPPWMASSSPPNWWMAASRLASRHFPGSDKALIAGREDLARPLPAPPSFPTRNSVGASPNLQENLLPHHRQQPEQEEAEELLDVQCLLARWRSALTSPMCWTCWNTLKCDQIRISLSDSISSAIIEDFDIQDAQYVVMPMRDLVCPWSNSSSATFVTSSTPVSSCPRPQYPGRVQWQRQDQRAGSHPPPWSRAFFRVITLTGQVIRQGRGVYPVCPVRAGGAGPHRACQKDKVARPSSRSPGPRPSDWPIWQSCCRCS